MIIGISIAIVSFVVSATLFNMLCNLKESFNKDRVILSRWEDRVVVKMWIGHWDTSFGEGMFRTVIVDDKKRIEFDSGISWTEEEKIWWIKQHRRMIALIPKPSHELKKLHMMIWEL